ncbi:hypothetical protein Goklo_018617, partial [Gossypium klotzschianum]|nr:hypothetical protein [Gossypium klotzschianum]
LEGVNAVQGISFEDSNFVLVRKVHQLLASI